MKVYVYCITAEYEYNMRTLNVAYAQKLRARQLSLSHEVREVMEWNAARELRVLRLSVSLF